VGLPGVTSPGSPTRSRSRTSVIWDEALDQVRKSEYARLQVKIGASSGECDTGSMQQARCV